MRIAAELPRAPAAAATARLIVRDELGDVVDDATLDNVLLVVSELATNAVLHGAGTIRLRLEYDGGRVAGAVSDEGPAFAPRPRNANPAAIGGQGLHLVGRLSERWGLRGESAGVWFEMPAAR